jgi:dienelactone hydrolase
MEAALYVPDGSGPFPSVVVIHTSPGITEVDRQYCARLAREGFICIAPAFLRAYGIKQDLKMEAFTTDREAIMADFRQIVGVLDRLPMARPRAVGAVGFSNGGFFSVLLAAQGPGKGGRGLISRAARRRPAAASQPVPAEFYVDQRASASAGGR